MCGIAGIVSSDRAQRIEEAVVHGMCQTIVHRGPDDEGIFVKQNTGLGMRRLSIIDLVGGHQPVFNEDRSVWIVFNGEIYNFLQLRRRLQKSGQSLFAYSVTLVLLVLY